jgi:hypothetical protein
MRLVTLEGDYDDYVTRGFPASEKSCLEALSKILPMGYVSTVGNRHMRTLELKQVFVIVVDVNRHAASDARGRLRLDYVTSVQWAMNRQRWKVMSVEKDADSTFSRSM